MVDLTGRCGVALTGLGDRLRVHVADLVEGVAKRLPDADRLAAEPGREMPDRVVLHHVLGDHAGAGREPVAHYVGDELRPALAPQILGHHRAIGVGEQRANLFGALGDAAMYLAGAEHGVLRARFAGSAGDEARLVEADCDRAGDRTQGLAPADDAGDRLLVHAVLQRDDIAVGPEILLDHRRRPGGVVALGADKGDVERLFLGELLQLGHVQRTHRHGERLHILEVRNREPVLFHVLDMLGPEIDKGHVLAGLDHMRPGIAADRAGADDRDLFLRHSTSS